MKKTAIALLLCLLAACSTTPNYNERFGDAVREANLKMTIDPDAGKKPDEVAGVDGKAAREAIILYQKTFKTPPQTAGVTNVGGGQMSGSGGSGQ